MGLLQASKADSHTGRKDPNRFRFLHSSRAFVCLIVLTNGVNCKLACKYFGV